MNRDCILEMNAKQSVLTKQLWKNVLVATLHYSSSYFTIYHRHICPIVIMNIRLVRKNFELPFHRCFEKCSQFSK